METPHRAWRHHRDKHMTTHGLDPLANCTVSSKNDAKALGSRETALLKRADPLASCVCFLRGKRAVPGSSDRNSSVPKITNRDSAFLHKFPNANPKPIERTGFLRDKRSSYRTRFNALLTSNPTQIATIYGTRTGAGTPRTALTFQCSCAREASRRDETTHGR